MKQLSEFIINHWQLSGALVVLIILMFINELISQKNKTKELDPQMAVDLINNAEAVVIDIREKDLFKKGHIIDSINASADDFNLPKMNKYKEKKLILVCAKGIQAASVASKIRPLGFQPLVLKGGITSWQQADLPLIKK
jgi:rhodanese-related sulfurtransferase